MRRTLSRIGPRRRALPRRETRRASGKGLGLWDRFGGSYGVQTRSQCPSLLAKTFYLLYRLVSPPHALEKPSDLPALPPKFEH
jgi:hypothetical protein